jgi:hypothetical protein
MNREERALAWETGRVADQIVLSRDEPWPNELYIRGFGEILSPLGYTCYMNHRGAVRVLVENGADPLAVAQREGARDARDALDVCVISGCIEAFQELIQYVPITAARAAISARRHTKSCTCFSDFHACIDCYFERNKCFVAIGWALCQLSRDDLIEPVLQRLAAISLDVWATTPQSPVSKKMKK